MALETDSLDSCNGTWPDKAEGCGNVGNPNDLSLLPCGAISEL